MIAYESGEKIVELVKNNVTAKKILTKEAIMNGILIDMALGGSTNTALHIPAIAHEVGIEITLDTFEQISKKTPHITNIKPGGEHFMEEFDYENKNKRYEYEYLDIKVSNKDHSMVIEEIKKTPDSRRLIVSAWNVADIDEMAKAGLPPCHCFFQFYVVNGKLSCQLYQRSCDTFLGVPFNIASYSLFTMIIAQICGLEAGEFVWTGGDVHLYLNHLEQVNLQLSRRNDIRPMPKMKINPNKKNIKDFTIEDFELIDYNPHEGIKAPIAV